MEHEGFSSDGKTFVVVGNTFVIKDELKAAGAKFCYSLGWHFPEKPEAYTTIALTTENCFTEDDFAALNWNAVADMKKLIAAHTPRAPSASEYLGEVSKRLKVAVTLKKSFSFENDFGTTYIHNFEDEVGNVIIWKTANSLIEYEYGAGTYTPHELKSCEFTGTVKEHSEWHCPLQT